MIGFENDRLCFWQKAKAFSADYLCLNMKKLLEVGFVLLCFWGKPSAADSAVDLFEEHFAFQLQ